MKDYKLSKITEICKAQKTCNNCEFYIEDGDDCMILTTSPDHYEIDEEHPKDRVDTLEDTIGLMISADYKERFEAEYYQLKIRRDKLQKMWDNWDNLSFTPTCKKEVYTTQLTAMNIYLDVLKQRAEIEGIELNK